MMMTASKRTLVWLAVMAVAVALLSGCKMVDYVPVETVKTVYQNHTDTVVMKDTVLSKKETIIRDADSALVAKLGLQLKDNEKAILILQRELERQVSKESEHKTDTVLKTDSIQVPYPVERKLSKWEKVCIDYGKVMMGATLLLVVVFIIWLVRQIRNRISS